MASWSPGGTLDWWVERGPTILLRKPESPSHAGRALCFGAGISAGGQRVTLNAFGPPAANERHGRWLTLTPNLSGTGLRHEYPRVRYGNQPRGPAVAADAEDHLYAGGRGNHQTATGSAVSLGSSSSWLHSRCVFRSVRHNWRLVGEPAVSSARNVVLYGGCRDTAFESSCLPTTFSAL
jgi:hypothetical protein